ncbi:MAG: 2-oxo acid dehydrogenase subunit E2 [Deltaproteobacteria bacterium]|nr:2-oxo acid dehydrogenase subunit E2 [Deltaproteobacteria bacterium]
MKKNRSDGEYIKRVHPFRTMLGYIMPTRNESVVYFDDYINVESLLDYLKQAREKFPCDVTHCLVAATGFALRDNPKMNQFLSGHRLYQRKDEWVTFSAKRQKLNKKAKLTAVKYKIDPEHSFRDLCEWVHAKLNVVRSDKVTREDKELGFFTKWPRPLLKFGVGVVRWLDYHNILMPSFIEHDGFYTSVFIANLGSLGMQPGYHHLYEWGNCPLFMMAGKIEDRPMVEDGKVVVRKMLHVRWSYDERIDDGLGARFGMASMKHAMEHPFEYFGCLADDGSDRVAFAKMTTAHPDEE